ncbi:MAG TPA: hypothetical protein DCM68_04050 [Verrucomicrobia bacterium]|nr:hypothetical protein [Verrucomicrobiota bacterium]
MTPRTRNARAAERYGEELRRCPNSGGGVHSWMMTTANLAAIAGIPATEAEGEIIRSATRPPSPSSEVASAIRKAYAEFSPGFDYEPRRYSAPKPKPLPQTAQKFIQRGDGAEESDWWEASPIRIAWEPGPRDALALLGALYAPGEFVFCGERYGAEVRTAGDWISRIEGGETVPPHWIPNPLTGNEHPTGDGKQSRRGDSAVASFRFAVAEFDGLSKPDQLAFWWGFRTAPIVALIDSGGKSVHAILKVNCATRADWTRDIEEKLFPAVLCPLGCDPACRNESRLSRLPGHFRREKNAWQRLLYLNPEGKRT